MWHWARKHFSGISPVAFLANTFPLNKGSSQSTFHCAFWRVAGKFGSELHFIQKKGQWVLMLLPWWSQGKSVQDKVSQEPLEMLPPRMLLLPLIFLPPNLGYPWWKEGHCICSYRIAAGCPSVALLPGSARVVKAKKLLSWQTTLSPAIATFPGMQ